MSPLYEEQNFIYAFLHDAQNFTEARNSAVKPGLTCTADRRLPRRGAGDRAGCASGRRPKEASGRLRAFAGRADPGYADDGSTAEPTLNARFSAI